MSTALAELGDMLVELPGFNRENFNPQSLVEQLTDEQVAALLEPIQKQLEWVRTHKYDILFPDEGQYPRHRYPKHVEFFNAGAQYRERCFMAANRVGKCRLYNDLVPHPDGTTSRIGDLFVAGKPFDVIAWDGKKAVSVSASHVIRKPPEMAVRLYLSSGKTFTCSLDHRVLTDSGWQHVRSLLQSAICLPHSTAEADPLTHAANDPRWSQITQDLRSRYLAGRRQCDEQPLDAATIVRALSPLPDGVQQHNPPLSPLGSRAGKSSDSPSLFGHHPSNLYEVGRYVDPSSGFEDQAENTSARRNTDLPPEHWQQRAGLISHLRSARADGPDLFGRVALVSPNDMAYNHVVAYEYVGCHALYDMTVPDLSNYIADGIVHHNTVAGAFETTAHMTGLYKPWWEGRRFTTAIDGWAAGDTNETTRDIIQKELFGEITWGDDGKKCFDGSGMVPRDKIGRITWKSGVQDLADVVLVKHVTGRWSRLGLKSYDQGRRVFQGTAKSWIWLDEECPLDVYGECLYRTATTGGLVALTFTPLLGISETVLSFLPAEMRPDA